MLTQAMPALTKALEGIMPPAAIRQITQALGNCSQGVVQRGDVTLTPSSWANVNNGYGSNGGTGRYGGPGTYTGNAWSPQNYKSLFDNTSTNNTNEFDLRNNIDIAGNTYYHSDGGSFPIYFNQTSTMNYAGATYMTTGGPTFGDTYITDIPGSPGKNGERGEAAIDGINGEYFSYTYDGEAGADGSNGGDGQPGGAGAAGAPGGVGAVGHRSPRRQHRPRMKTQTIFIFSTDTPQTLQSGAGVTPPPVTPQNKRPTLLNRGLISRA